MPGDGRADDQVLQLASRHPAQPQDPVHRLAGELADVDLRQGGRLPGGEIAASPGPVGDSGAGEHAVRFLHIRLQAWFETLTAQRPHDDRVARGAGVSGRDRRQLVWLQDAVSPGPYQSPPLGSLWLTLPVAEPSMTTDGGSRAEGYGASHARGSGHDLSRGEAVQLDDG